MVTILVAIAIGLTIFGVSLWTIRLLATPPPPEPDPDEVIEVAVAYRCTVCGMRLTVTEAQGAEHEAPRHCREQMVKA